MTLGLPALQTFPLLSTPTDYYLDIEHPLQKLKSMGLLQRKKFKIVSIQSVSTKSNLFKNFVAKFHNFTTFSLFFFPENEKRKRKIGLN
jgi:hypothetical protein